MNVALLFEWMSELGAGRWADYRDAHDWLGASESTEVRAAQTMHTLAMLGHVESDWKSATWATAPSTLTIIPNGGAQAILVGARTRKLMSALHTHAQDEVTDLWVEECPQRAAPSAVFVAGNNESDLQRLAEALNIAYELCVGERLAAMLPELTDVLAACRTQPPVRGYDVDRYNVGRRSFQPASDAVAPGFYRHTVWRRKEYRILSDEGTWHLVDFPTGVYAELRRVQENVLHYRSQATNGNLSVPAHFPLPALQARSAVLCTGLLPSYQDVEKTNVLRNVPRETAISIAASLGQTLKVE